MPTYRQIQERVRRTHGFVPKTCWIAHVKAELGLTGRPAPNRPDFQRRKHRCPPDRWRAIVDCIHRLSVCLA
jgi:hypothetical protein